MIVLLPNRYELRTLHALKDRGFVISTIRFPSGVNRNVALEAEPEQEKILWPAKLWWPKL